MRHERNRAWRPAALTGFALAVIVICAGWTVGAQVGFSTGQDVVPVYEGWLPNADGSFDLVFGYFNRNWEEELDVPVGPDNFIEPGPADQGQPTHFYPRRSRFQFHVRMPKDFSTKEVVWTLTTHGKTEKTYGTLKPDYAMDDIVIMNNNGAGGSGGGGFHIEGNKPPTLTVDGDKNRTVSVGQSVMLSAMSTDDGIPKRRVIRSFAPRQPSSTGTASTRSDAPGRAVASSDGEGPASRALPPGYVVSPIGTRCCPDSASGLRVSWYVYRGPAAKVTFDPPQIEAWEDYRDGRNSPFSEGWEPPQIPPDNKWTVHVKFAEPGTYVLRCLAHDGGLFKNEDITFVVR